MGETRKVYKIIHRVQRVSKVNFSPFPKIPEVKGIQQSWWQEIQDWQKGDTILPRE